MTITAPSHVAKLPGRPREFDMNEAIDRALDVFSERGYHAASISELTDAMGLASGSIYKAFKDKRGIFLAAFDRYRARRIRVHADNIAAACSGRDKIRALLDGYADVSHGPDGRRGCLVIKSALDMALLDEEAAGRVTAAFEANEKLVADLLALGKADGSVAGHVDVEIVARSLLCLMSGMRVLGKTGRSRAEMAAVADAAMKFLD